MVVLKGENLGKCIVPLIWLNFKNAFLNDRSVSMEVIVDSLGSVHLSCHLCVDASTAFSHLCVDASTAFSLSCLFQVVCALFLLSAMFYPF